MAPATFWTFVPRRPLALKLDTAFFGNRGLFDRDHLAFHLSKLGRCLLIAAYKERRWPKHNNSRGSRQAVLRSLAILRARQRPCPCRYGLSLKRQLLARV